MEVRNLRSLGVFVVVLFVGCGTARPLMPVPETLEASAVMPVKRSRASLGAVSFGEWQVTSFKKDRFPVRKKWGMGIGAISFSKSRGDASYRFVMTPDTRDEWECSCEHKLRRRDLGLGRLGGNELIETELTYVESLECDIRRVGDPAEWKLLVDGSLAIGGTGYTGTLVNGTHAFSLEANHEIEGLGRLPGPPMGYLFVRDGEDIASAELIRPGVVRIGEGAGDDRDVIATAAAALLMQPQGH